MKTSSLTIHKVVTLILKILRPLKTTFTVKNDFNDDVMNSGDEIDPFDLVDDEDQNQIFQCNLVVPSTHFPVLFSSLQKTLGEPTLMRGYCPVWKYGKKNKGQLWLYPDDEGNFYVDIRYYYDKV